MRRRALTILPAACLLLLAAPGCIFEPRTPEPPSTGTAVTYLPQNSSVNVWTNLQKSLNAGHAPGWEDNISQTEFAYHPDTAAEGQFPGVFAGWDRTTEVAFINRLYNSGVTIEANLNANGFVPPPDEGGAVWEGVIYDIKVTTTADQSVTEYRGSAIITFTFEGNLMYITDWRDQQGESSPENPGQILPTMGVLRGTFASK